MLFYPEGLNKEKIKLINDVYQNTDPVDQIKKHLSGVDFENLSATSRYPTTGGICLTYNCQLRCNYCSFCSNESCDSELTIEDVDAFVSYLLRNILIVILTVGKQNTLKIFFSGGGEPTYDWSFFVKVVQLIADKCKRNNIMYELNLTTNGILNDSQIDFIAEHFKSVMISFDGLPELQCQNRISHDKNISSLTTEKTIIKFQEKDIEIILRTTVWAKDFCKLKDICKYIFSKFTGIYQWSILPTIETGRAIHNRKFNNYEEANNFLSYYLDMVEYAKKSGVLNRVDTPFFPNNETTMYCGSLNIDSPWLLPDRNIVSCLEAKDFKSEIGKISKKEVVVYEKYQDITAKKSYDLLDECNTCIAFRFCRGGCPLKFLRAENGSYDMLEWECEMIREYWKYIFERVLQGETVFGWYLNKVQIDNLECSVFELKRSND